MPAATNREAPAFVRCTSLGANEYHTNFRKIDRETISRLTSDEAARETTQMCKVYLSLLNAPAECWEREGVLRFAGEERGGAWVTAWEQLVSLVGVASATARKAIQWMHGQGIVGYFAGKNGVGIRVFMNRASSSIGVRPGQGQKNLRLVRASPEAPRASACDTPFKDSYADLEVLEKDINPRAPKNGAGQAEVVKKYPGRHQNFSGPPAQSAIPENAPPSSHTPPRLEVPVEEIVSRLRREVEPSLQVMARRAAAQEHERTREWLESRGLPKAARVAQREAFNVLRQRGLIGKGPSDCSSHAEVGRNDYSPAAPQPLADAEAEELAQACVAMLEVRGQPIERTLSEMSAASGGFLLPEDVPRVRQKAERLVADLPARPG